MAKLIVYLEGKTVAECDLEAGKDYTLGRGSRCDIVLSHPKVSRQHAVLNFDGKNWVVKVLSKYGNVLVNGAPAEAFSLTSGSVFSLPPFEMKFADESESHSVVSKSEGTSKISSGELGVADKTQTGLMTLRGILRRLDGDEKTVEDISVSDGRLVAGRSHSSGLRLNDPSASRKHFEIVREGQEYILRDLESANKTLVNGREITQHLLQSGDIISVGHEKFRFEILNPAFENLPVPQPELAQPTDQRAVMRIDPSTAGVPQTYQPMGQALGVLARSGLNPKNKRVRMTLFAAIIVLLIVVIVKGPDRAPPSRTTVSSTNGPGGDLQNGANIPNGPIRGIERLSMEQKKFVDETYNVAYSLYTTGKYEEASLELNKIFQLVDDYKDSKKIQFLCQQALAIQKQQQEAERARREQEETKRKVAEILDECENLLKTRHYGDVEGCVGRTADLDPDNERGQSLVTSAKAAMDAMEQTAEAKAAAAHRKRNAEIAYVRGGTYYKSGKLKESLREFQTVVHISFNDTSNLKPRALRFVAAIKDKLHKESATLATEGRSAMDSKDFGTALKKYSMAISRDPANADAREGRTRAQTELHLQLKNTYSESVIEENLGNIEQAKKKWKDILRDGDPADDYYVKAKIKLQKYEK